MRVFVTGASGHIGSAVIPELLAAGHQVLGLARSDAAADAVESAGAEVVRGSLEDLDVLAEAAHGADGVIHLAFRHDWMRTGDFAGAVATDLAAVTTLGEALAGSGRPFVSTSGIGMLAMAGIEGRLGTEEDILPGGPRVDAENHVVALADRRVRSSVIRLPPTVHSDLDRHGFIPVLVAAARKHGHAAYLGEGTTRWSACDTRDAARLYRLALEAAPAGSRLHGVAEEGVPFRVIEETIARALELPVRGLDETDAEGYFGFLARFAGLDLAASSARTRATLGWQPTQPGLIADLESGHYLRGD